LIDDNNESDSLLNIHSPLFASGMPQLRVLFRTERDTALASPSGSMTIKEKVQPNNVDVAERKQVRFSDDTKQSTSGDGNDQFLSRVDSKNNNDDSKDADDDDDDDDNDDNDDSDSDSSLDNSLKQFLESGSGAEEIDRRCGDKPLPQEPSSSSSSLLLSTHRQSTPLTDFMQLSLLIDALLLPAAERKQAPAVLDNDGDQAAKLFDAAFGVQTPVVSQTDDAGIVFYGLDKSQNAMRSKFLRKLVAEGSDFCRSSRYCCFGF
jgi:hypothetical protein